MRKGAVDSGSNGQHRVEDRDAAALQAPDVESIGARLSEMVTLDAENGSPAPAPAPSPPASGGAAGASGDGSPASSAPAQGQGSAEAPASNDGSGLFRSRSAPRHPEENRTENGTAAPQASLAVEDDLAMSIEANPTGRLEPVAVVPARRSVAPAATPAARPERVAPETGPAPVRLQAVAFYALVIAGLMGASILAAVALSFTQAPVYGARTDIIFELDGNLAAGFLREDRRLTTQVVTIESRAVLAPAAARLDMDVEDLGDVISAQVVEGSEIIEITAEGDSEQQALDRLNAVTAVYLARVDEGDSSADALNLIGSELADLEAQAADLQTRIDALLAGRQVGADQDERLTVGDAEVAILLGELEGVRSRIADLERRRDQQELDDLVRPRFEVLTPAFVLEDLLAPNRTQMAALGALLGAMVGTAVVFGLERRTPRLR